MRRVFGIFSGVALALISMLPCGCDVHEFPSVEEPVVSPLVPPVPPEPEKPQIEVVVSLENTDWPEYLTVNAAPASRAPLPTDYKLRYSLNVYVDSKGRSGSRAAVASKTVIADVPEDYSAALEAIAVDLDPGQYSALVWVDHVDALMPENDLFYSTDDFAAIALSGSAHNGNNPHREAFRGMTCFSVLDDGSVADSESRTPIERVEIHAERPMARFEFITTDLEEYAARSRNGYPADSPALAPAPNPEDYTVRFRYTGYMPSVYNAYSDKPVDSATGVSFSGQTVVLSSSEASLGFDHVLVNGSEANVQVALDVYDSRSGALIASSPAVSVPLRRNRHTIVRGKFLTSTASGGVGINTDFDGSYNIEII